MALPAPEPGLVVPYLYLWRREHEAGEETGRKARPAVVVIVAAHTNPRKPRVAVAPVTSRAPDAMRRAIELPKRVLTHLGLPAERSWVICDEYNVFEWPGPDMSATATGKSAYGYIPDTLIERIRAEMRAARDRGSLERVPRTS